LPAGGVARQVPADGWCSVHAVIEKLRRLHADIPSCEEFLKACFDELSLKQRAPVDRPAASTVP
jgi:hypothetical protein